MIYAGVSDAGGIYEIVSPSGKRYIGSAARFRQRFYEHRRLLRNGTHHCGPLQNAWKKYGEEAIVFQILEVIENPTREILIEREQWFFDHLKPAYNIARIAGSRLGVPASPETVEKMRAGTAASWQDPEIRARRLTAMALIDHDELQRKRSNTREQRKAEGKSYVFPANVAAMAAANRKRKGIPTGRVFSSEQIAQISAKNKAFWTPEKRAELGAGFYGRTHGEAAKAKMAAAKTGKPSVKRKDPTKCAAGLHPWIPENLAVISDGRVECRTCKNDAQRAGYRRRQASKKE